MKDKLMDDKPAHDNEDVDRTETEVSHLKITELANELPGGATYDTIVMDGTPVRGHEHADEAETEVARHKVAAPLTAPANEHPDSATHDKLVNDKMDKPDEAEEPHQMVGAPAGVSLFYNTHICSPLSPATPSPCQQIPCRWCSQVKTRGRHGSRH